MFSDGRFTIARGLRMTLSTGSTQTSAGKYVKEKLLQTSRRFDKKHKQAMTKANWQIFWAVAAVVVGIIAVVVAIISLVISISSSLNI